MKKCNSPLLDEKFTKVAFFTIFYAGFFMWSFLRGFRKLRGFLRRFRNLRGVFFLRGFRIFSFRNPEFTRFFHVDSGIYAIIFYAVSFYAARIPRVKSDFGVYVEITLMV